MPASFKHLKESLRVHKSAVRHIFAKWPTDGLYYKAQLLECDEDKKKCLLKFEDQLEQWMDVNCIHTQLALSRLPQDNIICSVCEDGTSVAPNEIIICEVCEQGYHQNCHVPHIESAKIDRPEADEIEIEWICNTCSYIASQKRRSQRASAAARKKRASTPGRKSSKNDKVLEISPAIKKVKNQTNAAAATVNIKREEPVEEKPKPFEPEVKQGRRKARNTRETQQKESSLKTAPTTRGKDLEKARKKVIEGACDNLTNLEKVIPKPKDFEGENNPFVAPV